MTRLHSLNDNYLIYQFWINLCSPEFNIISTQKLFQAPPNHILCSQLSSVSSTQCVWPSQIQLLK